MEKIKLFSEIPFLTGEGIELHRITGGDADGLNLLRKSETVYRYLPTFLYEQQYEDINYVIDHLYDECLKESLILGVYREGEFCGIAEFYGFRDKIHKVSIGYRLREEYWGQGIATRVVKLMLTYLLEKTDIEIITASTMIENQASANVLRKNGFILVVHDVPEDWGFPEPTAADKWLN